MIEDILALDEYANIFGSIYILRELINISPILNCTLGTNAVHSLT